jgi:hypothetical protein
MFMIYLLTKFLTSSSSGSLVIAIIEEAKCRFRVAAILYYIPQDITLTNIACFLKIHYSK